MGAAYGNVRPEFPGRLDERQSEQICCDCDHGSGGMGFCREPGIIVDRPEGVRVLDQGAEDLLVELEIFPDAQNHLDF